MGRSGSASWNANVRLALLFSFLSSAARGVWAFTTLSVYLMELSGTSTAVGAAEGIQGLAQALAAVAAGVAADWVRRDTVLHLSGLVGLCACGIAIFALLASDELLDDSARLWAMTGALGAMGCFQGISSTCIDTLYADSVKTGKRSKFNTFRFVLTQVSGLTGPVICVILFLHFGNEWTWRRLTDVFLVGICLNLVPVAVLFFMSDDHTLGLDSESHHIPSTPGSRSMRYQRLVDDVLDNTDDGPVPYEASPYAPMRQPQAATRPGSGGLGSGSSGAISGRPTRSHSMEDASEVLGARLLGTSPARRGLARPSEPGCCAVPCEQSNIATLLVVSDMISALGSGMSVKFFPLFFKMKLHMAPVGLNCVYIALPIFMTAASIAAQRLARRAGRVQVCLAMSSLGCLALFGLAFVDQYMPHHDWRVVLPIYFCSTLQHCTRPLRKAVLMDYVPKARRARFNSIESITRMNWSGSAVLGGLSIHRYGFGHLFFATALIQLASVLVLMLLMPLVPVAESARLAAEDVEEDDDDDDDDDDSVDLADELLGGEGTRAQPAPVTTDRDSPA